ncbi:MAG: DNA-binding protein [Bacteroidetes bacterium]|nr:MAG: DNA-binding protein [Bacteroidota bacterium]
MTNTQPNIEILLNQLIVAVVEGRICEMKAELKKKILIENKPWLTVDDFSNLTGLKRATIYKYCSEGKIGFYRPTGKHTFFTMENVREFILNEKHYNRAKSEIRRKVESEYILNKF